MKCIAATALARLVAASSLSGNFTLPVIHGPEDYPEAFRLGWGRLTDAILAHRHLLLPFQTDLPFLPEITQTRVSMFDGTELSTTVVNPAPHSKRKGTVVCRSPYGPMTSALALIFVVLNGYVAVMQDDRGTFLSGGTFDMFRQANDDGLRTLEWIVSQPWSNGEVFSVGISADGMGEIAMLLQQPPMLKGQWWGFTTGNGHDFVFPQGVYRQDLLEGYMHFMSLLTRGASVNRVIPEVRGHEAWSSWWYNITDAHTEKPAIDHFGAVHFPVVSSAGWWDIFLQRQLDDFEGIRTKSDPSVRDKHVLIVGPLGHCAVDALNDVIMHSGMFLETVYSVLVAAELASEFFAGHTSGAVRSRLGRINLFVMAGFGHPLAKTWWTSLDDWPPYSTWTLYLQASSFLGPSPAATNESVTYKYDPLSPTPMLGGGNIPFVCATKGACGTADQLEREARSDVVVFDSEELRDDLPVVGRISARLFVSSSAKDTDFVVTLSDLTPGFLRSPLGKKSMLVRYGAIRMRWRSGDTNQSAPLSPGNIYEVEIDLMTVAYIFPKGHRIRVAVSSAAAPYYNPNSNTGKFGLNQKEDEPVPAMNVIHFAPAYPSSITLPVVSKSAIPPNVGFHGRLDLLRNEALQEFV
mmetsp:Transcript_56821/g.166306  ORF Transcript_56821/g.166306 Transcript_56821/m.166306 type:complete len:635 (-) Transcript_56821:32-1936(-)